ncbi:MAG: hypothetical protein Kow0031_36130 [Anaerolineae bacterium]
MTETVKPSTTQQKQKPLSDEPPVAVAGGQGKTILVVEDNETNIFPLSDFLRYHGYQLNIARNGLEAVQQAAALHPNLILMDIQMPKMDGITAIQHIRANSAIAHTPIIALSASVMPGDRERSLQAGANEFIGKPFKMKELLKAIQNLIQ